MNAILVFGGILLVLALIGIMVISLAGVDVEGDDSPL
jgi:hypothetical protein